MKNTRLIIAAAAAFQLGTAIAQSEQPAVSTSGGSFEQPALQGTPERRSSPGAGTTVLGDRESPIGLYIIPWRSSAPTPQMDRPARLLDETEEPVDPVQFSRFIEYHDALTRHREAQRAATP
jgi:hypothetical protein